MSLGDCIGCNVQCVATVIVVDILIHGALGVSVHKKEHELEVHCKACYVNGMIGVPALIYSIIER